MPPTSSKSRSTKSSGKDTQSEGASEKVSPDALSLFHPITAAWFRALFDGATPPQREGWPAIARGESTLILAPTGTGKTLTAFLWELNQLIVDVSTEPVP